MTAESIAAVVAEIESAARQPPARPGELAARARRLCATRAGELATLAAATQSLSAALAVTNGRAVPGEPSEQAAIDMLLAALFEALAVSCSHVKLSDQDRAAIEAAYRSLAGQSRPRALALQALAIDGSRASLALTAELLASDPPERFQDAALAMAPLFQQPSREIVVLFPRLLDALAHPQTAALALDVANFATRRQLVGEHPARERAPQLAQLLGSLVERLLQIEELPDNFAGTYEELSQSVEEGIALFTALCDALALIGDPQAIGKLHRALEVGHRRLRTEAAAALARLGEVRGLDALVNLAADPAARSRALAYLDELGQLDRARAEDRRPAARAAGELAAWLAEPAQLGLPPASVELVDAARWRWPSYDQPVDCYLLLYEIPLAPGTIRGVGIVGPITYSLGADLTDLPPADIYAAYAGWQAEHEEIRETPAEDLSPAEASACEQKLASLPAAEYADVQLVKVGHFFGERLLVASATRDRAAGTVIVEPESEAIAWYSRGQTRRPVSPYEAYLIHKGRKLLRAFNRAGPTPLDPSRCDSNAGSEK